MIARLAIALSITAVAGTLLAPATSAQRRGMREPGATPRSRSSFRIGGGEGVEHSSERRSLRNSGLLFPPYFYADYEFDQEPEAQPVQMAVVQPAPPPPPVPSPIEPLLMEKRNGEWVRVATGSQMAVSQSPGPDSAKSTSPRSGIVEPAKGTPPVAVLPPAVIVFRDGHQEEVGKYMIQGDVLYTNANQASTAPGERKIPLAQLDLPASLKLNRERGAKFSLPSAPNEVVVRF